MKPVSGRDLVKALERHDWQLLRIHGSHHIFGKEGVRERLSIPMHGNTQLKAGLLNHLMKLASLSEEDFTK